MSIKKNINCNSRKQHIFLHMMLRADRFSRAENVDVVKFSQGTLFVSIELRYLTNLYLLRLKQRR